MSSELQPVSDAAELSGAHRASLVRALVVCAVWLATLSLRDTGPEVRLGLNLLLTGAGLWAAAPGRKAHGPAFGEHGHWSSLVIALPIGFGIAAAVELWHMMRGHAG
jgi:hypothetical protein